MTVAAGSLLRERQATGQRILCREKGPKHLYQVKMMLKTEQCQLGFENKPTELHILVLFPPLANCLCDVFMITLNMYVCVIEVYRV